MKFSYSKHAKQRMKERKIKKRVINSIISNPNKIIKKVTDCRMVVGDKSITVVIEHLEEETGVVVTVYRNPQPKKNKKILDKFYKRDIIYASQQTEEK
jgi:hypothetical protein